MIYTFPPQCRTQRLYHGVKRPSHFLTLSLYKNKWTGRSFVIFSDGRFFGIFSSGFPRVSGVKNHIINTSVIPK